MIRSPPRFCKPSTPHAHHPDHRCLASTDQRYRHDGDPTAKCSGRIRSRGADRGARPLPDLALSRLPRCRAGFPLWPAAAPAGAKLPSRRDPSDDRRTGRLCRTALLPAPSPRVHLVVPQLLSRVPEAADRAAAGHRLRVSALVSPRQCARHGRHRHAGRGSWPEGLCAAGALATGGGYRPVPPAGQDRDPGPTSGVPLRRPGRDREERGSFPPAESAGKPLRDRRRAATCRTRDAIPERPLPRLPARRAPRRIDRSGRRPGVS